MIYIEKEQNCIKDVFVVSRETFKSYAKQMGEDYTDPYNPKEALDVMGYMFSKKQQNQWSCYKKVT